MLESGINDVIVVHLKKVTGLNKVGMDLGKGNHTGRIYCNCLRI